MAITLTVTHPDPEQRAVTGFMQLWAYYVRGFDPTTHCQDCLKGKRSRHISRDSTALGTEMAFDETANFEQIYICGVALGPEAERKYRNLHLALRESPGSELEVITHSGFKLLVRNAVRLSIPEPLPVLAHLGASHYRCCNFRFGVEYYGYPGLKDGRMV